MAKTLHRICLWSGPRNISTALMYAFAQRPDTTVYDEPLYAHYLSKSKAKEYHPGAEEILLQMENDGSKVVDMMLGEHGSSVAFFKHMTHHLIHIDLSFLQQMQNVILTRDPKDMLPSYAKQVHQPSMQDVGYAKHLELIHYFQTHQIPYLVLDSRKVLENPEEVLSKLCGALQIPFEKAMLSWEAGARTEDGCWAKFWYKNVHQSTGFQKYKAKTAPFPAHLEALLADCEPIYQKLLEQSI